MIISNLSKQKFFIHRKIARVGYVVTDKMVNYTIREDS